MNKSTLNTQELERLDPREAMDKIQANPLTVIGDDSTILYSTNPANSFEEFKKTLLVVEPHLYENFSDYNEGQLEQLESFYVYGSYILSNGIVGGLCIEKRKGNGGFSCMAEGRDINTIDLSEAEKFLYTEFYVHQF